MFLRMMTVFVLSLVPLTAGAVDVLLLGDTDAEFQVQPALEGAGHTVTFGGVYYDWDGVTPAVTDFDVVVFLNGEGYGYELQPAAAAALESFVPTGGRLVMTEWTAYDVCGGDKGEVVANLMPVIMPDCNDYGEVDTWTVDDPSHPLAAGLPGTWTDDAAWSTVVRKLGSAVVVSGTGGNPMVVYSKVSDGTVVYLNHDMTYTTATMNPNALQLMVNAAEYAQTTILFFDGFETQDVSAWSSVTP